MDSSQHSFEKQVKVVDKLDINTEKKKKINADDQNHKSLLNQKLKESKKSNTIKLKGEEEEEVEEKKEEEEEEVEEQEESQPSQEEICSKIYENLEKINKQTFNKIEIVQAIFNMLRQKQ
ncbi:hypothetical protein ABPG72_021921 [Tetrahymena utriculariae]